MNKNFIILGMPRSMTAWLSAFLTCGSVFCQHELSGKLDSPQEITDSLRQQPFPFSGLADPGALMIWQELTELLPDATLIYVRRESHASQRSLEKAAFGEGPGFASNLALQLRYDLLNRKAADFLYHSKPKVLEFHDLQQEHWLRQLWSWCSDADLPEAHLRKMMTLRVTQKDEIIQAAANSPQTKGAIKW